MVAGTASSGPRAVTDGDTILASVEVGGPPERVFRALVTDEVERWWGSDDAYRMTRWSADLRIGGQWSVTVRLPDGRDLPASGEFLELSAPRAIAHTRQYEWDHPTLGRRDTVVTWRLDPIPDGTRVTVRHDGFVGQDDAAEEHARGWERALGWLESYMRNGSRGR
jgi:uncharacterized protein YndB with AHSA1/START domain